MIDASAPVRICDNGGWTDTWFGGPGKVLNVAVTPGVRISIGQTEGPDPVMVAVDELDPYPVLPGSSRVARHALVEAAVDMLPPSRDVPVEIRVRSAVPVGCGAGTSAAVAVALLGALSAVRSEPVSPRDIAYAAHRLEVDVLGAESGIQDQLSAAFGGINYLEIDPYPEATVRRLPKWEELDGGLTLVYVGRAHDSSGVHRRVIEQLARHRSSGPLDRLRAAAVAARDAVLGQDLRAFGRAMIANTEAQRSLHHDLVGVDAERVIELAGRHGALGWKVNGAGGDGGSLTILNGDREGKTAFEGGVAKFDRRYQVLPVRVASAGLVIKHGSPA